MALGGGPAGASGPDPAGGPPPDGGSAAGGETAWSRGRLRFVLALLSGTTPRGGPDTRAAAELFGVSQRSVQRWLRGADAAPAAIPAGRLQQVTRLALPDPEVLEQEQHAARYAREALARVALPKDRGVLPAWRERRWLEPHLVAVLELPRLGLRQIAVSRGGDRALRELRRRGEIVDFTVVATRFHANLLVHEVLDRLSPWRLQAPAALVKQGSTQTWTADAPAMNLDALAVTQGLR